MGALHVNGHRRVRRNADEEARRLERAAEQGDPAAAARLIQARIRSNTVDQLPLRVFVAAALNNLQLLDTLPADLRTGLSLLLAARDMVGSPGNWFPEHTAGIVCPRGHALGTRVHVGHGSYPVEFSLISPSVTWFHVEQGDPTTVFYQTDTRESEETSGLEFLQCQVYRCNALWRWPGRVESMEGDYE